ncbi:MAG: glycosyltransferase family 2 protein [Pseudomonadota bacterium]
MIEILVLLLAIIAGLSLGMLPIFLTKKLTEARSEFESSIISRIRAGEISPNHVYKDLSKPKRHSQILHYRDVVARSISISDYVQNNSENESNVKCPQFQTRSFNRHLEQGVNNFHEKSFRISSRPLEKLGTVKISIIVRGLNEGRNIKKLFGSLLMQKEQSFEVILVDSGSTDNSVQIADTFGVKIVKIDRREFTFGKALNLGCATARGDFLVIVSAHAVPMYDDWLSELLKPLSDPSVKLSYGMQRGGEENYFSECCLMESWFPDIDIIPQLGYFCNNANLAIRKRDWDNQPFDERLPGLEDLAWAKLASRDRGNIAYTSTGGVFHIHDDSTYKIMLRYYREALAFVDIEPEVTYSISDLFRYTILNIAHDAKQAIYAGRISAFPEILKFRIAQSRGTYRAFKEQYAHVSSPLFKHPVDEISDLEKLRNDYDFVEIRTPSKHKLRSESAHYQELKVEKSNVRELRRKKESVVKISTTSDRAKIHLEAA